MTSGRGFRRLARIKASTKRQADPDSTTGQESLPVEILSSDDLKITPLYPVTPELAERLHLGGPMEVLVCYAFGGVDILEGDILIPESGKYADLELPIRAVGDVPWRRSYTRELYVESIQAEG